MRTLLHLQETFQSGLTNPAASPFLQEIKPHTKVPPLTQFIIYRNSIVGKFQKALKDIYPVCKRLVGEDFFMAMATSYIETHPSYSPDLNAYGVGIADFVTTFAPAASLPYLADVARLEWAWHQIFSAQNNSPFDFQKLLACYQTQGGKIIFSLPPQSTLLTSPYPIHHIWETNQKNNLDPTTILLEPDQQYYLLIWRKQFELRMDNLDATEWQLLQWLHAGCTLDELAAKAQTFFPELDIAITLATFVKHAWIDNFFIL